MLLVIMTKSLIRLGNTFRASLNNDRTDDNTGITKGYNDGTRDYDSITRSYRREREGVGTNTNNDDITRVMTNGYEDITKDYNERE